MNNWCAPSKWPLLSKKRNSYYIQNISLNTLWIFFWQNWTRLLTIIFTAAYKPLKIIQIKVVCFVILYKIAMIFLIFIWTIKRKFFVTRFFLYIYLIVVCTRPEDCLLKKWFLSKMFLLNPIIPKAYKNIFVVCLLLTAFWFV